MNNDPQKLRAVTFREAVRLPGTSNTGHFIPAEDYPLTYFPTLGLIRATLKRGVSPLPHQSATRYYHMSVVKDLELLEEPVELAMRDNGAGVPVVTTGVRVTADGTFERIVEEPVPPTPPPAPTPSESPGAKRRGRPPKVEAKAAEPPAALQHGLPSLPRFRAPSMGSGSGSSGGGV